MIRSYSPILPTRIPSDESARPAPAPDGGGQRTAKTSGAPPEPAAKLTGAEQSMIDRYFPENERMSLRLYGPRQVAEVNPRAVGTRLDVRG